MSFTQLIPLLLEFPRVYGPLSGTLEDKDEISTNIYPERNLAQTLTWPLSQTRPKHSLTSRKSPSRREMSTHREVHPWVITEVKE